MVGKHQVKRRRIAAAALGIVAGCLPLRVQSPRPFILLFGDSLCYKNSEFYLAMTKAFPTAEIEPNGVVGAPTWTRAARFSMLPDQWTRRPDLVVVLMGVNNFTHDASYPPELGWDDLEAVRARARWAGVPILIGTPLPYPEHDRRGGGCSPSWNGAYVRRLRALLLERSGRDVVDFDEAVPPEEAERLLPDCLHPNAEGGVRMAALVRTTICERRPRHTFSRLCH